VWKSVQSFAWDCEQALRIAANYERNRDALS
jgi:hypothetical protein